MLNVRLQIRQPVIRLFTATLSDCSGQQLANTRRCKSVLNPSEDGGARWADDGVDQAVLLRLLGVEPAVAVKVPRDPVRGLASRLTENRVDIVTHAHELPRLVLDVGGLPTSCAAGVVHHDAGVWQCVTLPLVSDSEKEAAHAHGTTKANSGNVAANVPHGVVQGQRGDHLPAGAVDVQLHVLLVLGVKVQHGAHQLIAQLLIQRLCQKDDALAVQAVPDIYPLPASLFLAAVGHTWHSDGHHASHLAGRAGGSPLAGNNALGASPKVLGLRLGGKAVCFGEAYVGRRGLG
mmetsp:Transcript_31653/g.56644  ORF Transcript_31653/g.56644 Transcript_31653/m.56644 type:complete len:291 (+) Transcript_31653:87-959(+)